MSKILFPILATLGLCSALEDVNFGLEWQQRILSLGLEDNNATATGCVQACDWFAQLLPAREFDPDTTAYFKEKSFFWSAQQAEVSPQCFVQPANAHDVAAIVKLAQRAECPFAVKSGGHAAFAGGSNIAGGITIDLSLLNELTLSDDKTTMRIGPGNRWVDVYSYLDPKNLSVIGGRVAEIGVGGLIMGGGISFCSGRYGWALDRVRNYEVVVASGEVLDVNYASYPDLYWALRGGGNNFGIVTAFDLETFPQTGMWGGLAFHSIEHNATLLDALAGFAHHVPHDVDAAAFVSVSWTQYYDMLALASQLSYGRPIPEPAIFDNFTTIPTVQSARRLTNMTDMTLELNETSPNGLRNSYSTATFILSREIMQESFDIFIEEVEAIKDAEGIVFSWVQQVITTDTISRFSRNGGNCLGIDDTEGPLLNLNMAAMWKNAADDEAVYAATKRVVDRSVEKAKEIGVAHRYLYQNYADAQQAVFEGYGQENLARLREISRKYDPEQVFQRLQPGYFKL